MINIGIIINVYIMYVSNLYYNKCRLYFYIITIFLHIFYQKIQMKKFEIINISLSSFSNTDINT